MADSYLGKFQTILYLSIVYCIGNLVLALTSIPGVMGTPPSPWGMILGLALLALGSGGIKPNISSFGGDQCHGSTAHHLPIFFSFFYFSINAGSVLSMIMTPLLRNIHCLGSDTCFPLAFGVPALLMVLSLLIFVAGYPRYRILPVREGNQNLLIQVASCLLSACYGYWTDRKNGRSSLEGGVAETEGDGLKREGSGGSRGILDHLEGGLSPRSRRGTYESLADLQVHQSSSHGTSIESIREKPSFLQTWSSGFEKEFVADVERVWSIVLLFLPLPIFWSLYDQTGSRWLEQGRGMNGNLGGGWIVHPGKE